MKQFVFPLKWFALLDVTCVFTFYKWPQRDFPNLLALHLVPLQTSPKVVVAVDDDGGGDDGGDGDDNDGGDDDDGCDDDDGGGGASQANLIIRKVVAN